MKNKNRVLKTCLTALALSVAGLANAQDASEEPVKIFTPQLMSHAAISGAALSIAADSVIDGNLAAQAAVTIGAGLKSQTQHIYAGAAVTTGALSTVKNIFSGAATGIGASAHAQNVHAGAAITVGAGGDVQKVYAGAAITLGAGAGTDGELTATADELSVAPEDIHNAISMAAAIAQIGVAQDALTTLNNSTTNPPESLYTTMGGFVSLEPGVHQGSAVSIAANSIVEFSADNSTGVPMDHVWVINLSEALTVGAGTVFVTDVPEDDTATIIWNVGAAVTLGAGTEFIGTAFVGGAFGAATSNVSCGNIYATGAVSVGSIGAVADGLDDTTLGEPVACDTNAQGLSDFAIFGGEIKETDAGFLTLIETSDNNFNIEFSPITLTAKIDGDLDWLVFEDFFATHVESIRGQEVASQTIYLDINGAGPVIFHVNNSIGVHPGAGGIDSNDLFINIAQSSGNHSVNAGDTIVVTQNGDGVAFRTPEILPLRSGSWNGQVAFWDNGNGQKMVTESAFVGQ
jgi:hypothetical protein